MARVRGQFPDQAQNALIKLLRLERARLRTVPHTGNHSGASLVAGVDVGGGQSETVVYICESKPRHHRVINFGARLGSDTRGEVIRFLEPYREQLSSVRVDGIGIGHGFGHHLRDQGFPVELVNVALACASQPELGESDPAKRFVNEKARVYQVLADALEHDQLDGLADEMRRRADNSRASFTKSIRAGGLESNLRRGREPEGSRHPTALKHLCLPLPNNPNQYFRSGSARIWR
jgi:hypothetical protein